MKDECLFYKQSLDFWRYECDVFGDYFADEMKHNIYGFEKLQKRTILLGPDIDKQIDILCTDIILSRIEPLIEIEDYDGLVTIFEVVVNMIIQQAIAALKWKCNLRFCSDDNTSDIESRIQNGITIYPTIIPDIEFKVTKVLDTTIKGVESIFNHKNLKLPKGLIECLKCISDAGISSWMSETDKEEKKKNVMYVLSTKCKLEQYIADESKYNQYKLARKFVKDNNIYLPQMYMMFFNTLALIKKCEGKEYPLIGSDKFVEEKYEVVKNLFQPGSIYESILHVRPYDDPSYGLRVTNFFSGMLPSFISARKFNYKLADPGLVNYLELKVRRSRIGIGLPDDNINAYVFSTTYDRAGLLQPDNITPEEKIFKDYESELPATFFYIQLTILLNEDIETIEKYCRAAISGLPNLIEKFKKEKGIKSDKEVYTKAHMHRATYDAIKKGTQTPTVYNMVKLARAFQLTQEEALIFWSGIEDRKSEENKIEYIQSLKNE